MDDLATENPPNNELVPRSYQIEILEKCVNENTIIYLPTGSGKTYIAIMLINRLATEIISPFDKKTFFLVNTVPLIEQHYMTLKRHTAFDIGYFSGDMNVDYWDKNQWSEQIGKYQIIILTAQIFLDIIKHNFFDLRKANLLIFDECHQAVNDQPMRQIMQTFENVNESEQPKVLGLTATLLNGNCKSNRVLDEVKTLEITFNSKVATVEHFSQILGYSTNPKEKLYYFDPPATSIVLEKVIRELEILNEYVQEFKFPSMPVPDRSMLLDNSFQEKPSKKIKRVLNVLIMHIKMLGIYGGMNSALACIIQVERYRQRAESKLENIFYHSIVTKLTLIYKILKDAMTDTTNVTKQILTYSSPQVTDLIYLLKDFYNENGPDKMCCLIFVKQRFTTKALYFILKDLAESHEDFSFIKSDFMFGYNAKSAERETRENHYTSKVNKRIMHNFRNRDINVLIASNVVEEGIDIPTCTLVIKFDRPMDYRSYIQSKGRARDKSSIYIIMVPEEEREKYVEKYNQFKNVESVLQEYLIGKTYRNAPTRTDIENELYSDHDVPPYYVDGPNSAYVTATSAISLVNRYCQQLSRDRYMQIDPLWYLENQNGHVVVYIEMPMTCPLRDIIKGLPLASKQAAKRSAAVEVIKKLHQIGELTDKLLPKTNSEFSVTFDYLFTHWPKESETVKTIATTTTTTKTDGQQQQQQQSPPPRIPGTKKFVRTHDIIKPKFDERDNLLTTAATTTDNKYYVYPIVLSSTTENHPMRDIHNNIVNNSSLSYGLITRVKLPYVADFPIYLSAGEVFVTLGKQFTVELSDVNVAHLIKFNYFIFYEILKILQDFLAYDINMQPEEFLFVVPLFRNENIYTIDTGIMTKYDKLIPVVEPSILERINLNVTDDTYRTKIISPWYRQNDSIYLVIRVCWEMNALTPFPSRDFHSYQAYYKERYNEQIHAPHQPLVLVKGIKRKINCILPRSATLHGCKRDKDTERETFEEHLVPELCILQQYPGELWYQTYPLPTIIHRIKCLLRAEHLRRRIMIDARLTHNKNYMQKPDPLHIDFKSFQKRAGNKFEPVFERNVNVDNDNDASDNNNDDNNTVDVVVVDDDDEDDDDDVDVVDNATALVRTATGSSSSNNKQQQPPMTQKLTNKDYGLKMIEKQYNWRDTEEPVDLDRCIKDLTIMDIEYYEYFINQEYSYNSPATPSKQTVPGNNNNNKTLSTTGDAAAGGSSDITTRYPALTLEFKYEEKQIKMLQRSLTDPAPDQTLIFQCLTVNKANEIVNLERLETLGDSFLKFIVTLYLYLRYPNCNEGKLTFVKGKIIGNRNLLYCGLQKQLGGYMNVTDFTPTTDWLPPGFSVPDIFTEKIRAGHLNVFDLYSFGLPNDEQLSGILTNETLDTINETVTEIQEINEIDQRQQQNKDDSSSSASMNNFLKKQIIPDKSISDSVEALIGAYLYRMGVQGALTIVQWFGILPIPQEDLNEKRIFNYPLKNPVLGNPSTAATDIEYHLLNYKRLEENLGYTFKNRAYLLQALTHPSYCINRVTDSYQILEFIGDAVLDFLITCHIYEISDNLSPGELTDLRSALVNNVTFACLVVRYGFHKHLKLINTKLMDSIDTFVKHQEMREHAINEETLILVEDHPMYIAEYIDVPKVLGDIFESLAAAVFLDTDMNLEKTWQVFYKLMWNEIETFRRNVPKNPIRMLYETPSAAPNFIESKVFEDGFAGVVCSIMQNGKRLKAHGFGENKLKAKRAAAKLALKILGCP